MRKKRIAFLLFPKTQLMDFAGPAQVFYEAGQVGGRSYDLQYASVTEDIETEQQIRFSALREFTQLNLQQGDLICLPGIDFKSLQAGVADAAIRAVTPWIKRQRNNGVEIATICTGSLLLGKMGLLDGIQCATHWKCVEYFREQFPRARLRQDRLYCLDQGIFTSAGMTSGIDMALALIERWDNPLIAARVAQEMVINIRRPDTEEQKNIFLDFKNHFNPDVYQIQEILSSRLEVAFTIQDLGRQMNKSPRHLSRLFKVHTGKTIQQYRNEVRLQHGQRLLLHSEMTVNEVALACGFDNVRQFIRLWKKSKGVPPGQFRKMTALP
ncbi:GlxA family transcriptional regulator [Flavilitoribacter nigricans]|nr:helix-turn-helix domain-containing protein [Flavilitoribacter nigricans]